MRTRRLPRERQSSGALAASSRQMFPHGQSVRNAEVEGRPACDQPPTTICVAVATLWAPTRPPRTSRRHHCMLSTHRWRRTQALNSFQPGRRQPKCRSFTQHPPKPIRARGNPLPNFQAQLSQRCNSDASPQFGDGIAHVSEHASCNHSDFNLLATARLKLQRELGAGRHVVKCQCEGVLEHTLAFQREFLLVCRQLRGALDEDLDVL